MLIMLVLYWYLISHKSKGGWNLQSYATIYLYFHIYIYIYIYVCIKKITINTTPDNISKWLHMEMTTSDPNVWMAPYYAKLHVAADLQPFLNELSYCNLGVIINYLWDSDYKKKCLTKYLNWQHMESQKTVHGNTISNIQMKTAVSPEK